MNSSDIIATIIKEHKFICFECQRPVGPAVAKQVGGATMISFKCHGQEEHVPVPNFVLRSTREARKCHQILDTLVPFLRDPKTALGGNDPQLPAPTGRALPPPVLMLP